MKRDTLHSSAVSASADLYDAFTDYPDELMAAPEALRYTLRNAYALLCEATGQPTDPHGEITDEYMADAPRRRKELAAMSYGQLWDSINRRIVEAEV